MTTIKQQYKEYIDKNFEGLRVCTPLFFKWKFGMRFNLQEGDTDSEKYFTEVVKRSIKLFEVSFDQADEVFLVYRDYKWRRNKIRFTNYCFKQIDNLNNEEVSYSIIKNLYDKEDIYNAVIIKTKINRINYKNILTAISNTDFPPRKPRFKFLGSEEIYFINSTKNLIFHMYDDRGLDIITSTIEPLKPIYSEFNNWILDANRAQIDKLF